VTMLAISVIGIIAVKKVSSSEDFSVGGRKSTSIMVAGTILGSIVGGGGTVGTAEAAFAKGIWGWWQTLGLGIGCLVLGLFFANHIYKTRVETVPQVLTKTYGSKIGPITSFFGSIAIFFSIISQLKAFIPLLTAIVPMDIGYAAIIGIIFVFAYVLFGGLWGTSMAGIFKMVLIYIAMVVCGVVAFVKMGGLSGMVQKFDPAYFNLFPSGIAGDLANGISLMMGVLVTQIYIQGILSAKDAKAARNGAYISAVLTLPLGLLGVAVGMYMKTAYPALKASTVLPQFFLLHMPPFVAGIFIATLMITTLGSFAGLALGVSTMVVRDIYKKLFRQNASDKENLLVLRLVIVVICVLAAYFSVSNAGVFIQTFVFLSFGLRTCVFLVPMMFAFYYKGRLTSQAGLAAVICGPVANIVWNILDKPFGINPVYIGLLAASVSFILANEIAKRISSTDVQAAEIANTAK
ncbi:MAG: sodium:solute symporter family protein, partial [Sporomusa sp.]